MKTEQRLLKSYTAQQRRDQATHLFSATTLAITFVTALLSAALSVLFHYFPYTLFPYILDAVLLLAICSIAFSALRIFLLRKKSLVHVARHLDNDLQQDTAHPLITIALELSSETDTHYNKELCDEVSRRACEHISLHKAQPRQFKPSPKTIVQSTILAALVAMAVITRPLLLQYISIPLRLFATGELTVLPGTIAVPRYATVMLSVQSGATGVPSSRLSLYYPDTKTNISRQLRPDTNTAFSYTIDSITRTVVYQFSCGSLTSSPETLHVVPPPYLSGLSVSLSPPSYIKRAATVLPSGQGDFTALAGSKAAVSIISSRLKSARIVYNSDTLLLPVTDSISQCGMSIDTSGRYHFVLTDSIGQTTDSIGPFTVQVIPDEPPQLRFLNPGKNKQLETAQIETLLVEGTDDVGIRTAALFWRLGNNRDPSVFKRNISPDTTSSIWHHQFIWKISTLSLYPGDTLFYWASARDADPSPRKHAVYTDTFWLRVPTFSEMHQTLAEREKRAHDLISGVSTEQGELREQLQALDKATSRTTTESWEQQELADQVAATLLAQEDSLKAALEELEDNAEKLRTEGALNNDLAQKMEEIQKAVQELIKAYGDSLLFPRGDRRDLSLSELKEAVDKLNSMLPELEERLDNTLKYLEMIKNDRELAMLALRAEKLAAEESRLAENSSSSDTPKRQKELLEQIDALTKDIAAQQSDASADEQELQSQIDAATGQLEQEIATTSPLSKSTMQQLSGSLASLSERLREKTSAFKEQQMAALRSRLLDMAGNLVNLADWQDAIGEQKPQSEGDRRSQATEQQAIGQALGLLRNQLDSIPMLPPSLKQQLSSEAAAAREASSRAVQSLGSEGGTFGMQQGSRAMRQMANSALALLEAMENQSGGSCNSPGGAQESLRKMSGKQSAINAATAALLRQMLGGQKKQGGSSGMQGEEGSGGGEAARKEAQQKQQALAEELKKLGEKFGDASGASMKKRIDELEKEARNLSAMLTSPREEVTERQDRFLARMLQSALSLHREDEGKEERASTTAKETFRPLIESATDTNRLRDDAFYTLRKKALQNGSYPASYRSSINAYFDSLSTLYLR